jgi:DNA-directed RNA polymerase specialized sigma subunit
MDYKETVNWLSSYRSKYDKCIYIRNAMTGLKAISYTEHYGNRKTLNEYIDELNDITNEMDRIEKAIQNVEDYPGIVLGYKYLQFKTYKEIALLVNYSPRQVRRLHKKGISLISPR